MGMSLVLFRFLRQARSRLKQAHKGSKRAGDVRAKCPSEHTVSGGTRLRSEQIECIRKVCNNHTGFELSTVFLFGEKK